MRLSRSAAAVLVLAGIATAQTAVLIPSKDNSMYSEAGFLSNGAGSGLFSGVTLQGNFRRALMAFDVAGTVPAGATIQSVQLQMEVTMANFASTTIGLHRVTQDWGEAGSIAPGGQGAGAVGLTGDASWTHRFLPATLWSTPGGDFAPTASGSLAGVAFNGTYVWTSTAGMVADVQSWLDTPATNFGWCLVSDELSPGSGKRFGSREAVGFEPTLTITYTGGGPVASVTGSGAGCNGSTGVTVLATTGLPQLGNLAFSLNVSGGALGDVAFYYAAFGIAPAPLFVTGPNCFFYLDLLSALTLINLGITPLSIPVGPSNVAVLPFPVPNDPGLSGFVIDVQALLLGGSGFSTSNALTLTFGS